jgi:subtilisin family serine protease
LLPPRPALRAVRRPLRGITLVLPLALLAAVAAVSPAPAAPLRLAAYEFEPADGLPALPDGLDRVAVDAGAPRTLIVQLAERPTAASRSRLERDVEILGYLPDDAYLVRADADAAARLAGDPAVRWTGDWLPAFRISPAIGTLEHRSPDAGDARTLLVWAAGDASAVSDGLAAAGARVVETFRRRIGHRIVVEADPSLVPALANVADVLWIEEKPEFRLWNDRTTWVAQGNVSGQFPIWDQGLHGEGQIATVMDSGLDYNSCWFRDPGKSPGPSHRKVINYTTFGGSPYDGCDTGHGTHVCGTLAGNQTYVNNGVTHANGMATEAKLTLQDVGADDFFSCLLGLVNVPNDLTAAYNASYALDARVHSNSWGSTSNAYDGFAVDIDDFMWAHPDFLVVFAAGNSGPSGSTVGSPGTAKNCITVGATQQTPNQNSMASYSSRGPASDGRTKPTLCLPGGDGSLAITSADNNAGNPPPNTCNSVGSPFYGTSMATPAVSGSAVLVRQYFEDGFYPSGAANAADALSPPAALVKAVLVNTATDMGAADIPNNNEGWGRILLDDALYFDGDARELRIETNAAGLGTGGMASFDYQVEAGEPLEIVLVWTDAPATSGASVALVNDLDLEVEGPGGTTWLGNVFTGGQSTTGGSAERRDVEEVVRLASPAAGTYTVRVHGFNVPDGPQPFALASSGAFASWPPTGATGVTAAAVPGGARLDLSVSPNPARQGVTASLSVPGEGLRHVVVEAYDVHGARVALVWDGVTGPGTRPVTWDGRTTDGHEAPAGVYFLRATSGDEKVTRKALVLR